MDYGLQIFFNGDFGAVPGSAETTLFMVLLSFVVGQFIGWIYMATHEGLSYSRTFVSSLVVVPVIIALMMVLMAGSIVIAFGLLAVFAVVRFRNVLKDTRDTVFILWAILTGLGIGTFRYSTTVLGTVGVAAIFAYLRMTAFGSRHRYDAVLDLHLQPDSATVREELKRVLRRHCSRSLMVSSRVSAEDGGQVSYRLLLRDPDRSSELSGELRGTSGIAQVDLFLAAEESEI